jgi:hypothetical protein
MKMIHERTQESRNSLLIVYYVFSILLLYWSKKGSADEIVKILHRNILVLTVAQLVKIHWDLRSDQWKEAQSCQQWIRKLLYK